jgi:hypothetical protein
MITAIMLAASVAAHTPRHTACVSSVDAANAKPDLVSAWVNAAHTCQDQANRANYVARAAISMANALWYQTRNTALPATFLTEYAASDSVETCSTILAEAGESQDYRDWLAVARTCAAQADYEAGLALKARRIAVDLYRSKALDELKGSQNDE